MTKEFDRAREDAFAIPGYLFGLTMSTAGSSTSLTVAAGFATDSAYSKLMRLASALTKTTSAWAAGNAQGGLDTGTIADNWYHFYLIHNPTSGVTDIIFSYNAGLPALPTGYTMYRRIGSAYNASGNWRKFIQVGDLFMWDTPHASIQVTNPGTSAVLRTMLTPNGLITKAKMSVAADMPTSSDVVAGIAITDPATADYAPGGGAHNTLFFSATGVRNFVGWPVECNTDINSRVRSRLAGSGSGTVFYLNTLGWEDSRGRLN